jgi:hypothetical protein
MPAAAYRICYIVVHYLEASLGLGILKSQPELIEVTFRKPELQEKAPSNPTPAVICSQLQVRNHEHHFVGFLADDLESGYQNSEVSDRSLRPHLETSREFGLVGSIAEVVFAVLGGAGGSYHLVVNTVVTDICEGACNVSLFEIFKGLGGYAHDCHFRVGIHSSEQRIRRRRILAYAGNPFDHAAVLLYIQHDDSISFHPVHRESPCAVVAARRDHQSQCEDRCTGFAWSFTSC